MQDGEGEELPEELRRWLEREADDRDADRSDLLARAVAAYRLVADGKGDLGERTLAGADGTPSVPDADADAESLAALTDRVAAVEAELAEKITDVRERVVQVKRESDRKAPADHDHPALAADVDRVETGLENYETVLEHLVETADDLERKADRLAGVTRTLRTRVEAVEHRRNRLTDLTRTAARLNVKRADCGACGESVRLGLLATAACPYCETPLGDLEPGRRLFGTATLVAADPPALDGGGSDDDGRTPPDRGGGSAPAESGPAGGESVTVGDGSAAAGDDPGTAEAEGVPDDD
jgi:predicted Zn-ribbon and HTH transcriptional regulator